MNPLCDGSTAVPPGAPHRRARHGSVHGRLLDILSVPGLRRPPPQQEQPPVQGGSGCHHAEDSASTSSATSGSSARALLAQHGIGRYGR